MTHTVRLTIWPDRVLDISDAEHLDLSRRGMVLEDIAPVTPAPAVVPVEPATGEQAPAPAAIPPASGRRRKRAAGEQPPTTPPAPE